MKFYCGNTKQFLANGATSKLHVHPALVVLYTPIMLQC